MDDKDLLILQYVNQEKNLTKAAEQLYMTQPALTYRLHGIEKEFGIDIFSKDGRYIKLTPAGKYLVDYAKKALGDLRQTKEYVLNMGHDVQGSLKVGVFSYFGLYKLPALLDQFMTHYPQVRLNVDTGLSTEVFELLLDGEIDVAIVRGDFNWYEQKQLLNEENICIISKDKIEMDQLPKLPRINHKEPKVLFNYKNYTSSSLSQSVDQWWNEKFNVPPLITMQLDSFETCKEMVKKGLGYAIVPRMFIKESDHLSTVDLVFNNGKALKRRTWMLYRESSLQLAIVDKFVNYIKQTLVE